jgi:chemotaxis protein methyltransferase CheR
MNLMEDAYPLETFDLVLLRNVLIYFKLVEKEKILSRVSRLLATDGGYLILGSAETIFSDEKWQKRNATRGYYFQYHA